MCHSYHKVEYDDTIINIELFAAGNHVSASWLRTLCIISTLVIFLQKYTIYQTVIVFVKYKNSTIWIIKININSIWSLLDPESYLGPQLELIGLNLGSLLGLVMQRFSTCGPRTTSGPRPSAWWSAGRAWYLCLF